MPSPALVRTGGNWDCWFSLPRLSLKWSPQDHLMEIQGSNPQSRDQELNSALRVSGPSSKWSLPALFLRHSLILHSCLHKTSVSPSTMWALKHSCGINPPVWGCFSVWWEGTGASATQLLHDLSHLASPWWLCAQDRAVTSSCKWGKCCLGHPKSFYWFQSVQGWVSRAQYC